VQDRIFDELNTLSVVYRAPATTFIDAEQGAGVQREGPQGAAALRCAPPNGLSYLRLPLQMVGLA